MNDTLTIWQGIRIEVPATWEILQYSRKANTGYLAWADRYAYRLELNWKKVPGRPDFDLMMSEYQEKLEEDGATGLKRRHSHGWHGLVDPAPGGTVRYGTYLAKQERLLEVVFMWPERQDRALEDRVLASIAVEAANTDGFLRWRAFGLDATMPADLELSTCSVLPANAAWTFSDGDSPTRSWHVERLGMTDQWLTDGLREWLDGKNPADLLDASADTQTVADHEIYWTTGHMAALNFPKMGKRTHRYEAAAWICPADGRLYHVSRVGKAKETQPNLLVGGTLRCCANCPSATPSAAKQEVAT